jgi:hypothetical protein
MHIETFYKIVLDEWPCEDGRKWLHSWIEKNPDGDTAAFFTWAISKTGIKASRSIYGPRANCWLVWVIFNCLDWSEQKAQLPNGHWIFPSEVFQQLTGENIYGLSNRALADYLTRGFEGDE